MAKIPEKLQRVINSFEQMDSVGERIDALIEYADRFREVPQDIAARPFPEEALVPFCESEAYIWMKQQDDGAVRLYFAVASPSGISAKALAVILDETLSGLKAEEIADIPADVVYRIFGIGLSMGKGQGLMGMVAMAALKARELLKGKIEIGQT